MGIARTAFIDDDGSGTTGTVINNAVKTELYNQIDAALALLSLLAGSASIVTVGTITAGVWNAGAVTAAGDINATGDIKTTGTHAIYSQKAGAVTKISSVGTEAPFVCGVSKTFTFTSSVQNGMVFILVYEGTGVAALCVTGFASATIALLGDASIVNSAAPTAAQIGVSKGANSSVITVKAGSAMAGNISIMLLGGYATATTDPA